MAEIESIPNLGAHRHATNLRRPGANLTGLTTMAPDFLGKQLLLFK